MLNGGEMLSLPSKCWYLACFFCVWTLLCFACISVILLFWVKLGGNTWSIHSPSVRVVAKPKFCFDTAHQKGEWVVDLKRWYKTWCTLFLCLANTTRCFPLLWGMLYLTELLFHWNLEYSAAWKKVTKWLSRQVQYLPSCLPVFRSCSLFSILEIF